MRNHQESLAQRFAAEFESLGGQVFMAATDERLVAALVTALRQEAATRVIAWEHPELARFGGQAIAAIPGATLTVNRTNESKERLIELADAADAGLTWGDFAVADTGSLALLSDNGKSRSVSLLPAVHIAVVPASRLLATRRDLFRLLRDDWRRSAAITLVSGPSKTGDIDGSIHKGVHGPRKAYAMLAMHL